MRRADGSWWSRDRNLAPGETYFQVNLALIPGKHEAKLTYLLKQEKLDWQSPSVSYAVLDDRECLNFLLERIETKYV